MKTANLVQGSCLALVLVSGCAGTHLIGTGSTISTRGAVSAKGPAARAVVAGPAVLHAYSGFRGGAVYTVSATDGSDADCNRINEGKKTSPQLTVPVDRRLVVSVQAGDLACVVTDGSRAIELLWHAHPAPSGTAVAAR